MYKKLLFSLAIGSISFSSYAGFWYNTAHSRANCMGFNESVTWNALEWHYWRVQSIHFHNYFNISHMIDTFMNFTWRAAAYHMGEWEGERADNWHVQGYHYYQDPDGRQIYDNFTDAYDCRQYDGWWE